MAVNTGIGLTPQEFYYYAAGAEDLQADRRGFWTPNYSGAGFVQIPEWRPAGSYRVELDFYADSSRTNNPSLILGGSHTLESIYLNISLDSRVQLFVDSIAVISIPGVPSDTLLNCTITNIDNNLSLIVGDGSGSATNVPFMNDEGVTRIGNSTSSNNPFDGQIRNLRLTDIDNPQNSRFYPSIIRSENMPTDLVLVDELGQTTPDNRFLNWESANRGALVSESNNGRTVVTRSNIVGVANGTRTVLQRLTEGQVYRYTCDNDNVTLSVFNVDFSSLSVGLTGVNIFIAPSNRIFLYIAPKQVNRDETCNISLNEVTTGTLTNFPAAQPWVPLLGTNQAYLGNLTDGPWTRGVRLDERRLTSALNNPTVGEKGSFQNGSIPVGSILSAGKVILQVFTSSSSSDAVTYAVVSGTDAEIQAAFEYPNVFDIQPFDSATQAYNSNFTGINGAVLGVSVSERFFTWIVQPGLSVVPGSYTRDDINVGDVFMANNGASVRVISTTVSRINYAVITGTDEEIQEGFQWPNHFTVTPPP